MTDLFPDSYFHAGEEEFDFKEWEANPRIQKFMRVHGIKDGGWPAIAFHNLSNRAGRNNL